MVVERDGNEGVAENGIILMDKVVGGLVVLDVVEVFQVGHLTDYLTEGVGIATCAAIMEREQQREQQENSCEGEEDVGDVKAYGLRFGNGALGMGPALLNQRDVAAFLQSRKLVVECLDKLSVLAYHAGFGNGAVVCLAVMDDILRDKTGGVLVVPVVGEDDISLALLEGLARFVLILCDNLAGQPQLISDSLDDGLAIVTLVENDHDGALTVVSVVQCLCRHLDDGDQQEGQEGDISLFGH